MQNEKIILERVKRHIARQKDNIHSLKTDVPALVTASPEPIPFAALAEAKWQPIAKAEVWSAVWGSAWFMVRGNIPAELHGKCVGLWFDCDGEACVWKDGNPWQGLTPKVDWYHNAAKYYVPISGHAITGQTYEILIEAAANDLFGKGKDEYALKECALVAFEEEEYQHYLDLELLFDLANALPAGNVRRAKIIYGLNRICNLNSDPEGRGNALQIASDLLAKPANASALTAYSVGHAHLDLAWLWPVRESRRKGGRTFANALRLLEMYPQYIFGASQAQLYQWIKDDYPLLYAQVKEAVKKGRWDVQGASWVEFDTNLISGESIIRQFMYGKSWFQEEFGVQPDYLWLPDCFGFSANLPQFMLGCGVRNFVTQKLSWNETNAFPHHLFIWQGIDGSELRAHQLPTNDYNFSNNPSAFIATENRFAQAELADAFLNLYGIGDGGGGPTRNHIEYGIRQQNLEGTSRFRFSTATEFLKHYAQIDAALLPKMYGELYLEFHRGTYTTQAKMKLDNHTSEILLSQAEAVSTVCGLLNKDHAYPQQLRPIWQNTMLMQFHDILPGSSIGMVYEDAAVLSRENHDRLRDFVRSGMSSMLISNEQDVFTIFNPTGVEMTDWFNIFPPPSGLPIVHNAELLDCHIGLKHMHIQLKMLPFSFAKIRFDPEKNSMADKLHMMRRIPNIGIQEQGDSLILENEYLQVSLQSDGSIGSIWDKELKRELLSGQSNLLHLWEDEPNNWGAWDINHFYRETTPLCPVNVHPEKPFEVDDGGVVVQQLRISNSLIRQSVSLNPGSRHVRIAHGVEWQEHHKMLRVAFQPDIHSEYATCGVQMGSVQRPVNPRNVWEAARFEFPAQGFVDISDASHGFSLLSPGKYGYSLQGNRMELNLLRSPADVDPTADLGSRHHVYYFYCHATPYAEARVAELGKSLCNSFISVEGSIPPELLSGSLFALQQGNLILETIKPAEDGNGIILRLYEPLGRSCQDTLTSLFSMRKITRCDMLENAWEEIKPGDIQARPFEIITLRVELS